MTQPHLVEPPRKPQLPHAILPLLVEATERMLAHSDGSGRLMLQPGRFIVRNWYDVLAAAVAFTKNADGNPLRGDGRLADLLRAAGRAIREHIAGCVTEDPNDLWFNSNRPHEWILEHWLAARVLLHEAGAAELCEGWDAALRGAGAVFDRYCRQIERLRTLISPNLNISPNHFMYFAAVLLRIGQVLGVEPLYRRGLETAKRFAAAQHADGYWPETHGPTTSYNYVTTAAIGLCDAYTGEPIFERVLRRALDFHAAFSYPDGTVLETIDQRVRYHRNRGDRMMAMFALSRWPEGRGLAEAIFANGADELKRFDAPGLCGRLATNYLLYRPGPAAVPACWRPAHVARLSDLPGGVVHRSPWAVGLCGIPSRSRPHHYTLDRQNLLSLWHRDVGLILGGGGNRDHPEAATFHARIQLDPESVVHGITAVDSYIPVAATLAIGPDGGRLDLQYTGFDATLAVELLDDRTSRVTAHVGTLPANEPILFSPNVRIDPGEPLFTAAGRRMPTGEATWSLSADEVGPWIEHAGRRIELPPGATLQYPMAYWKQTPSAPPEHYALLTIPLRAAEAALTIRVLGA